LNPGEDLRAGDVEAEFGRFPGRGPTGNPQSAIFKQKREMMQ
jgi:hypothetical protein